MKKTLKEIFKEIDSSDTTSPEDKVRLKKMALGLKMMDKANKELEESLKKRKRPNL